MRILSFLGFLILYGAWLWACGALMKRTKRDILVNKTFWVEELMIFLGLAGLFVFIFVLSGYFNLLLVAAFLGAAQVGVVLKAILSALLGSPSSKWGPQAAWAGGEFGLKHTPLVIATFVPTVLIFIAYPVAAGISYFGLSPADVPARIFQYTLSTLFLAGYPFLLLLLIAALVSENIDEDTRTRTLVTQFSALVPTALWVALLFWSFGIAGSGWKLSTGSMSLQFSPLLLGVLIGFYALAVLIPYLIGAQRAKKWRTTLLAKRQMWMAKLVDILEMPGGSLYLPRLAALAVDLDDEIAKFTTSDPMIVAGTEIDQGIISPAVREFAPAYQLARDDDPRFKHLDFLEQMSEKIKEIRADLGKLVTEPDLEKAASEWTKYLQPRQAGLSKEVAQAAKTRTPALLILSGAIAPIFSLALSEFAKWLWTYFSKGLPQ